MSSREPSSSEHRYRAAVGKAGGLSEPSVQPEPPQPMTTMRLTDDEKRLLLGFRSPRRWRDMTAEELSDYRTYPSEVP